MMTQDTMIYYAWITSGIQLLAITLRTERNFCYYNNYYRNYTWSLQLNDIASVAVHLRFSLHLILLQLLLQLGHLLPEECQLIVAISLNRTINCCVDTDARGTVRPQLGGMVCHDVYLQALEDILPLWVLVQSDHLKKIMFKPSMIDAHSLNWEEQSVQKMT